MSNYRWGSDNPKGEQAPAAEADVSGDGMAAGGGGGGGDAAAGIMMAAAMIIEGVVGAVATGKQVEADPVQIAKTQERMYGKRIQAIDRLEREIAKAKQSRSSAQRWLDGAPRKQWMNGAEARRVAPPRAASCARIAGGDEAFSLGGHAYGDPGCRCKFAACAYKDPATAQAKRDIVRTKTNSIESITYTRGGGNTDFPLQAGHGNLASYRTKLQQSWGRLMGIRSFEAVLPLDPRGQAILGQVPPAHTLVGSTALAKVWPDDPDAQAGLVPFQVREQNLGQWLTFMSAMPALAVTRPPLWVYGFSEAEQRVVGMGPTIGSIHVMLENRQLEANPLPSGYDGPAAYGAAGGSPGLTGALKDMLLNPAQKAILDSLDGVQEESNTPAAGALAGVNPKGAYDHKKVNRKRPTASAAGPKLAVAAAAALPLAALFLRKRRR